MIDSDEVIPWRDRHAGHQVVPHELITGGTVRLPDFDPAGVTIPRRIMRGLRCEGCAEVMWLDELRPDEPVQ